MRVQINLEQTFFLLCTSNFITARKRSLGEGNIFTSVCHSFCLGGVGFRACITGHMTRGSAQHPLPGCRPSSPPAEIHGILWETVNKQAVRIRLEYILGFFKKNLEDISPFVGSLIFLFWTSGCKVYLYRLHAWIR